MPAWTGPVHMVKKAQLVPVLLIVAFVLFSACSSAPGSGRSTECSDAVDSDGDGTVDKADSDCSNPGDTSEGGTYTAGQSYNGNDGSSFERAIEIDPDYDRVTIKGTIDVAEEHNYFKYPKSLSPNRDLVIKGKRFPRIPVGALYTPRNIAVIRKPSTEIYLNFYDSLNLENSRAGKHYRPPVQFNDGYIVVGEYPAGVYSGIFGDYEFEIFSSTPTRMPLQRVWIKFEPGFDVRGIHEDFAGFNNEQFKQNVFNKIKQIYEDAGFGSDKIVFSLSQPSQPHSIVTFVDNPNVELMGMVTSYSDKWNYKRSQEWDDYFLNTYVYPFVDPDAESDAVIYAGVLQVFAGLNPTQNQAENVVAGAGAHELGHLIGLRHTFERLEVMCVSSPPCTLRSLLEPESFFEADLDPESEIEGQTLRQDPVGQIFPSLGIQDG